MSEVAANGHVERVQVKPGKFVKETGEVEPPTIQALLSFPFESDLLRFLGTHTGQAVTATIEGTQGELSLERGGKK